MNIASEACCTDCGTLAIDKVTVGPQKTCSPVGGGGGVLLLSLARMKQRRTSSVVTANELVAPIAIPIPTPELQ